MKQQNVKKLSLNKVTIQDLQITLDRDELGMVRGGSATTQPGTTDIAVYCR